MYSDCEITPSSSSAPALTGGCHGWHEAGSYPDIDDDDALWNCGNLAAGAQAWAAALAREISNAMDSDRYKIVNFVDATRYTGVAAWRVFGTSRSGRIAAGNPIAPRMSRPRKEITS